jgi:ATP/maltotriose-dependent transcriptional regulator MalT
LSKVLKTFVGGAIPDFDSLNSLSDEDKYTLSTIAKTSRLSHSVHNPNKSKQEQEDTEFEILRGQIASGQDNKDAVKKFKLLLVKMMNQKRIPKGQGMEILTELAVLGH